MKLRGATFLLCLAIVTARAWRRLVDSDLWAEDAVRYTQEALNNGLHSLFTPMGGSYHVIQRGVVLAGLEFLPIAWLPSWICAVFFLIFAGVASKFADEHYEWLVPSRTARVSVCVLFCCALGMQEMAGNLANLNWSLFFWLALVGLQDVRARLKISDLVGAVLVILSTGVFPLLIPLFCWRWWMARYFESKRPWYQQRGVIAVALLLGGTLGLLIFRGDRPAVREFASYSDLITMYLSHFVRYVAVLPWLGDRAGIWLTGPHGGVAFAILSLLVLAGLLAWLFKNRKSPKAQAMTIFLLATSLWPVLCCLARPAALEVLQGNLSGWIYEIRYSFPTSVAAFFFWMALLGPERRASLRATCMDRRNFFAAILVILNLGFAVHRFSIPAYGPERYWQAQSEKLKIALSGGSCEPVELKAYPEGWAFAYVSPGCKK